MKNKTLKEMLIALVITLFLIIIAITTSFFSDTNNINFIDTTESSESNKIESSNYVIIEQNNY